MNEKRRMWLVRLGAAITTSLYKGLLYFLSFSGSRSDPEPFSMATHCCPVSTGDHRIRSCRPGIPSFGSPDKEMPDWASTIDRDTNHRDSLCQKMVLRRSASCLGRSKSVSVDG